MLAREGVAVTVLEKNEAPGGRAGTFTANGFRFDMGPSWYWMPDVFERFFARFGRTPADYYELVRLDPSYQVFWNDEQVAVPAGVPALQALFDRYEPGAGQRLEAFMQEAAVKYEAGIGKLVYQPGLSALEFLRGDVLRALFRTDLLRSMHRHVRRYFRHPKLLQLTEFPVLFLGALPEHTPALYSLMNYADMQLGTWYPKGGMVRIVDALYELAQSLGVRFHFGEPATRLGCSGRAVQTVETAQSAYTTDAVIAACDYHHTENDLLPPALRNYRKSYWDKRDMAPSCLLFYIGVDRRLEGMQHHNLFFDAAFDRHARQLYTDPQWPDDPLMYVCCPSKTDATVAPEGCENLFVLIPVAPGLEDTEEIRDRYFRLIIARLEKRLEQPLRDHIVYQRRYACRDFVNDYHAFKGNAYGLANTLTQTAFMKPSIRNRKLRNLFYTGQLTVPGPGVPPALISGEIVAGQVLRSFQPKTTGL